MEKLRRITAGIMWAVLQAAFLAAVIWCMVALTAPVLYLAGEGLVPQSLADGFTAAVGGLGVGWWSWQMWRSVTRRVSGSADGYEARGAGADEWGNPGSR